MGAWDETAFGNDDAADWSFELIEAEDPLEVIEETLDLAKAGGYLAAPDGSLIVAAAGIVAAACGRTPNGLPTDLGIWLGGKEHTFRPASTQALAALRRVRTEPSELLDLWKDTEDFAAWCADLDSIADALV